jgi:hypothetical protein
VRWCPGSRLEELLLVEARSSAQQTIHHKSQPNKMEFRKNGFMKSINAQYWGCQLAGWGAYSAIGLTTEIPALSFQLSKLDQGHD